MCDISHELSKISAKRSISVNAHQNGSNMKKLLSILLLATFAAAIILTGCGKNTTSKVAPATETAKEEIVDTHSDDGRFVVGISMPDKFLERWNRDGAYLKDEFERIGCEVILHYSNNLIDVQIEGLRDMIEKDADLLVIAAVDGAALGPVLDEAKAANVKVLAYDRLIMNSDVVDYYVSFDNYLVGQLQAVYIIARLGLNFTDTPKNIELISGDPVDNNARYFYAGAMDSLKPYIDKGSINVLSGQTDFYVTSTAQWSTELAQQRLQIILTSYYPDDTRLDAVLCANDSTALGATRAIESDYGSENSVVITGQDGDIANIYNIINGTQSMTVFKALNQETIVAVVLGKALLTGETPDESLITKANWSFDCSFNTTDYDNGAKIVPSYLLKPVTVTAANLEEKLFTTGYYRRNSAGMIYSAK
jgi:putative multiple sugar transport system substrate-binding protein